MAWQSSLERSQFRVNLVDILNRDFTNEMDKIPSTTLAIETSVTPSSRSKLHAKEFSRIIDVFMVTKLAKTAHGKMHIAVSGVYLRKVTRNEGCKSQWHHVAPFPI